ncbi:MAG: ATP-binding protein [Ferruginibacter sp.]|nr:ATP-binding protein [Ferruginibacter sp.]
MYNSPDQSPASSFTRGEARLFEAIPGINVLLQLTPAAVIIVACTEAYAATVGRSRNDLTGKDFFACFQMEASAAFQQLRTIFEAFRSEKTVQAISLPSYWNKTLTAEATMNWEMTNTPLLDDQGSVEYIIHSLQKIATGYPADPNSTLTLFERERIDASPVAMAVITGDTLQLTSANARMLGIWKLNPASIGQSLLNILPAGESLALLEIVKQLESSGAQVDVPEVPASSDSGESVSYFDFTYKLLGPDPTDETITIAIYAVDVTRAVLAKIQAEENERRISNVIQTTPFPMGVYVGDNMKIQLANNSMRRIWNRGDDVIGKIYKGFMGDLFNPEIYQQLKGVYSTGMSYHGKSQPVTLIRDGVSKVFYFNYSFIPQFTEQGEVYGVLSTGDDITDLVTTKNAVEMSEQKAQLAIGSAELGTYEVDLQTNLVTRSERFKKIWGADDSADRSDYESMIHPEDLPIRNAAIAEAYVTTDLNYEVRVNRKSGDTKWVKVRGKFMLNNEGIPNRIIGVIQDVTEQKLFAQELAKQVKEQTEELAAAHNLLLQSNEYLQKLLNLLQTPLQVLAPVMQDGNLVDFRFRLTNSAYSAYAQTDPESIFDKQVGELFPGYFQTDSFKMIAKTWEAGGTNTWDNHYKADGLDIYNQMSATKMGDEVIVYFTDFTRLKNLQLELLRKIDELECSNRNLKEFAYAASHDLKEPIRKIHIFGGRLKKSLEGRLSEHELDSFSRMENASARMGSLVDDLLAYSHVSLEAMLTQEVDLAQLIQLVLSDLDLEIEQKKAQVHVGSLGKIKGHHRQLQQAFQNLVGNALKYSNDQVLPKISITGWETFGKDIGFNLSPDNAGKTFCVIAVEDNGIGFEQGDADIIFDVFTRLHGHLQYKGSGIGLSIVRKVIENHNGYITVKSQVGVGTTFTLYLPL